MSHPFSPLWRDDTVVVVDKAPGLLVHNSAWAGPKEETLTDLVRADSGEPMVPLHRLDRGTSGAVAFARQAAFAHDAQQRLGAEKHYLAIVRGRPAAPHFIDHPLDDDDVPGSPRKDAHSRLMPVSASSVERLSLVVMTLWTGRRHQARRHAKHVSHPIIGDATHGKGPLNRDLAARFGLSRLALHAWRLTVGTTVVEAPIPSDWLGPALALWPGLDLAALAADALRRAPAPTADPTDGTSPET